MREVTERDFRLPEFMDAKAADYEFRDDGVLVRKDRWEQAVRRIASLLEMSSRGGFEIEDVVAAVEKLIPPEPDDESLPSPASTESKA